MPRGTAGLVNTIRRLAQDYRVGFTDKPRREMRALRCEEPDVIEVLADLSEEEYDHRLRSHRTGEPMYVFKVCLVGSLIWIKLVLRITCVVVSFHEDETEDDEK